MYALFLKCFLLNEDLVDISPTISGDITKSGDADQGYIVVHQNSCFVRTFELMIEGSEVVILYYSITFN